jgi:hypothetical protein
MVSAIIVRVRLSTLPAVEPYTPDLSMEPTLSLDAEALKTLIKESVREVMREEWFKFFEMLLPFVDDEEQAEIETSFSPADHAEEDFVDITDWFSHENQAQ